MLSGTRLFKSDGITYGVTNADLPTAATTYAYAGWPVFPCEPRGKKPLVAGGFKAATTDAKQVNSWWRQWPNANIGYECGALIVVEVDGPVGLATMNALRRDHTWPTTLTAMSGRSDGGLHYFWQAPEGEPVRNCAGLSRDGRRGIGEGIDVRGLGGYVILPPSVHPSGRRYKWAVRAEAAPMPSWMVDRLRQPPTRTVEPPVVASSDAYAQAALEGELENVRTAPDGTLNHSLNVAALKLGKLVASGALGEGDVRAALIAVAVGAGHPERGAARTVDSGLRAGMNA